MKAGAHLLALLFASLACLGCTQGGERGFHSDDAAFMQHFKEELSAENVPYREDDNGFVRYAESDAERVEAIEASVSARRSSGVAEKFDRETAAYAKEALKAMKVSFRVESRSDGEWILWWPTSSQQEQELAGRIASIHFNHLQKGGAGCQTAMQVEHPC